MKINIRIKGNNNNAQETIGNPALHIRFKIHVQNKMYINLTAKIKKILETWHE